MGAEGGATFAECETLRARADCEMTRLVASSIGGCVVDIIHKSKRVEGLKKEKNETESKKEGKCASMTGNVDARATQACSIFVFFLADRIC